MTEQRSQGDKGKTQRKKRVGFRVAGIGFVLAAGSFATCAGIDPTRKANGFESYMNALAPFGMLELICFAMVIGGLSAAWSYRSR